jgi:mannitol 2-dehydrogenase
MTRLNKKTLAMLPSNVAVPAYDRDSITPGIVHIGVGGFHRAHEAVYLDDLMALGGANDWGICGVGLRSEDRAMHDALVPQDCLYTVVTRSAEGDQARIVGSLIHYLFAPEEETTVRALLASPQIRIVSLTITEGGYGASSQQPGNVFDYLAEALNQRRLKSIPPFTVLSCDNLQHNGTVARDALLTYASRQNADLAAWIAQNVAFPNCMVDRITPQTTESDRHLARTEFGLEDAWPVVCEPFRQWIIEDKFSDGRPEWERVGVQFVSDVAPYESMKLQLLNGSHFALAYLGFMAGFTTVPVAMADPPFRRFIQQLMDKEVTPLLSPVPGIDLSDYKATLLTRFDNPAIKDQITRLCLDGSSKFPKFLLPSLREALATGGPHRLLTLALAGWLRYLDGRAENGQSYTIDDPQAERLTAAARVGRHDPRPLLALTDIFGSLAQSAVFVQQLSTDLAALYDHGARVTLTTILKLDT